MLFLGLFLTAAPEEDALLVAVGDVMLSRGVAQKIRTYGQDYPFCHVAQYFEDADIVFCNLECVLTDNVASRSKGFTFRADPALSDVLCRVGFNFVSLANNHSLDCGMDGLIEMVDVLNRSQITPLLGVPVIREVNGVKIGAIAFNLVDGSPSLTALAGSVRDLSECTDAVIVSLHWGTEYRHVPSPKQCTLARHLVDAGADFILGHHPHRVQGIALHGRGVVAYSLGNFVFDQRDVGGNESVMLFVRFRPGRVSSVTILPFVITHFRPEPAGPEGERILDRFIQLSAALGTHVVKLQHDGVVFGRIYPFQDEIDVETSILRRLHEAKKPACD
ncbi:hypothetical protein AMJ40_03375 [candidate division TA06 bacterium DG_26]|uniref:Capsule synthesis protein CapA domain-containing protein n=1 Tax=candidate division TA06 bacterium DG_26 TaxID=1703771 RepID=A0A0S7WJA4_UNCT6|nr:MAG: hypothetical protein AMJ40_03375 [candidate division TA06 bacterium DG_26]